MDQCRYHLGQIKSQAAFIDLGLVLAGTCVTLIELELCVSSSKCSSFEHLSKSTQVGISIFFYGMTTRMTLLNSDVLWQATSTWLASVSVHFTFYLGYIGL